MKDFTRVALLCTSVCFLASSALGQTTSAVSQHEPTPSAKRQISCSTMLGPNFGMAVAEPTPPYSAVQESSTVQTLADGTHISRAPVSEKTYRDSQGRTRTERPFCHGIPEAPDAVIIEIHDPVSGYAYILDEQNHVAHRYASPTRQSAPPIKPALKASAAEVPSTSAISRQQSPNANQTTESLGSQTMEGVPVEGTRTTIIIPEGSQFNDRPIAVVSEAWMSPDMNIAILSKHNDPRYGESTTRLTNLELSNPILSLFQPPPDYKIVDETDRITLTFTRP